MKSYTKMNIKQHNSDRHTVYHLLQYIGWVSPTVGQDLLQGGLSNSQILFKIFVPTHNFGM